jgi:ElaB/YqjD/DUF883 family membrane-anchored ribosome-binding protein
MDTNKEYLSDLKQELNQYKKQLSSIKDSFKGKTNGEANQIYESLQKIFKEAGEAYKRLEDASAAEWEPLKNIANASFTQLRESFDELKDSTINQIEEYSKETLDASEEYIKNNPIKSIFLAAGIGFIIGRVLR